MMYSGNRTGEQLSEVGWSGEKRRVNKLGWRRGKRGGAAE